MVWHRNEGQEPDEILQNKFTAYVATAVQRKKASYIDSAMKNLQAAQLIEEAMEDCSFDIEAEALAEVPLYMKLQNDKLFSALSELTERERFVFFNRALDEMSLEELACKLDLSYKGVAAVYYRTIQKIKKKMKGEK